MLTVPSDAPTAELEPAAWSPEYDYARRTAIRPGELHALLMPASEVCLHMRCDDQVLYSRLSECGGAVALYRDEAGTVPFCAPVLPAEAGVLEQGGVHYFYPPMPGFPDPASSR